MTKNIRREITQLANKLQKLKKQELRQLRKERRVALKVVAGLDAKIAKITRLEDKEISHRKRTSPVELRERITAVLQSNPKGLSQKEISNQTKLPYGSVVLFLKRNEKEFRATGRRKQKRYFKK